MVRVVAMSGEPSTLGDRIGERMRSRLFEMCRVVLVEAAKIIGRSSATQVFARSGLTDLVLSDSLELLIRRTVDS